MLRPDVPLARPEVTTIPICVAEVPGIATLIRQHFGDWEKAQEPSSGGR